MHELSNLGTGGDSGEHPKHPDLRLLEPQSLIQPTRGCLLCVRRDSSPEPFDLIVILRLFRSEDEQQVVYVIGEVGGHDRAYRDQRSRLRETFKFHR